MTKLIKDNTLEDTVQNQNFTSIHDTTKTNVFPEKEVAYATLGICICFDQSGLNCQRHKYINELGYFLDNIAIVLSLREHALPD